VIKYTEMIFKILLIILIALPVVALATFLYFQVLEYIRAKNRSERMARRR
jgi:hypothetical protein